MSDTIKVEIELTMEQVMVLAELGGALDLDANEETRLVYNVIAYIIDRVQVERIKLSGATVIEYEFDPVTGEQKEKKS